MHFSLKNSLNIINISCGLHQRGLWPRSMLRCCVTFCMSVSPSLTRTRSLVTGASLPVYFSFHLARILVTVSCMLASPASGHMCSSISCRPYLATGSAGDTGVQEQMCCHDLVLLLPNLPARQSLEEKMKILYAVNTNQYEKLKTYVKEKYVDDFRTSQVSIATTRCQFFTS